MSGGGHERRKQEVSDWSGESCPQEVQRFQFPSSLTVAANPVDYPPTYSAIPYKDFKITAKFSI